MAVQDRNQIQSLYDAYFHAVGNVVRTLADIPAHCRGLYRGADSGMSPDVASLVAFADLVEPPAVVLDLGAGVSSYVFRTLFPSVVTVDHDPVYLDLVRSVCRQSGLSDANFFCGVPLVDADYVFFDYGTTDDRRRLMEEVFAHTRRLVWVNDADDRTSVRPFVESFRELCRKHDLVVEPRPDVRDCYHRYGSVVRLDPLRMHAVNHAEPAVEVVDISTDAATADALTVNYVEPVVEVVERTLPVPNKPAKLVDRIDLSVVFGTYNRLPHLQRCIAACRQSVRDLSYEIVVCDGGSTDGSREWLAAQPDVVLVGKRTLDGAVDAFNRCFEISRGEFVTALNDDAEVLGTAFADGVDYLREHPGCGQVVFAFRGEGENWHVNHVYVDALWPTAYANFGVTRCSVVKMVAYITGGMWSPVYYTYAGDCELSAWVYRLGFEVVVREDLKVEDRRLDDGLRARNSERSGFEAKLFYIRWPVEAFRQGGVLPNISQEELDRYREVMGGTWVSPERSRMKEVALFQQLVENSAPLLWPPPEPLWPVFEREPALAALAPRVRALDPVPDRFPARAEPSRSERVLHVHLGTEADPQAALVRAVRSLAADETVYRRIDWPGCPNLADAILRAAADIRPTFVLMQLQTPDVVSPGTIETVRQLADPSCVIATWNGDVASNNSPWTVDWQVSLGRTVDLTLHSSLTHVRALRAAGVHTAVYLQIGYDPEQYRPTTAPPRTHNVCFLGSRYYDDAFAKSLRRHEGALRDEVVCAMRCAFGEGFLLHGSGYGADEFGRAHPIPVLQSHTAYQASKLAVSISLSSDFEMYSSDRLNRALACGCAVLVKGFAGMGCWGLRHGENCLVWETADEAVALAQRVLRDGSWERIGIAGAALAAEHHTWQVRARELWPYIEVVRSRR